MTLRDEIRTRMEKVEMSQSELARRSGVPRTKINRYIRGGRLRSDNLEKIITTLRFKRMVWHGTAQ